MDTRFVMNFDFRNKSDDIQLSEIIEHFIFIISAIDIFTQTKKTWYETGYSRKNALSQVAFQCGSITDNTYIKWEHRYKKSKPLFVESIWDANDDNHSYGISYRKMFYDETNRASVEISLVPGTSENILTHFITLISKLSSYFNCSYMSVDSKGYSVLGRSVFPDRLAVGWMLYIPHVVLPELIHEAARIVPVVDGEKQKGTIVVSTEDIFEGSNKEHVGKANDIEIRLLDLGLLPLMTEI